MTSTCELHAGVVVTYAGNRCPLCRLERAFGRLYRWVRHLEHAICSADAKQRNRDKAELLRSQALGELPEERDPKRHEWPPPSLSS